jgi:hypothetical protein
MSFLTGFAKSNNLIENTQDRLAIQNLFPNLGGISADVALLINNIRNESVLEIKTTEITGNVITIVNTLEEFQTRSNVFTNGDKVDVYHLNIKQNSSLLTIINSNTNDTFSLSSDGSTPMDLTTLQNLGGVLILKRSDAVYLENFNFAGVSDIDYVDVNAIANSKISLFESVDFPAISLPLLLNQLDFTQRSRSLKYRQDGSLSLELPLQSQGTFTAKGDVDSTGDVPGLYITDATSPVDNIVAVRAFSNDNNPWTQNGPDLETEATTVTIGNLVFNGKIEIDGLSVATEFGAIADVFTHKLPITIDGQTYFVCLNKPT